MKLHYKIIFFITLLIFGGVFFIFVTSRSGIIAGIRSFTIVSGSMNPSLPIGTLILTIPQGTYHKGEIIAFEQNNRTITHRIIDIKRNDTSNFYQTKGDANNSTDTIPVVQNNIIGKSTIILPHLGAVVTTTKTPVGFIVFIILPALIFIGNEFIIIKREIEKEAEKRFLAKAQT